MEKRCDVNMRTPDKKNSLIVRGVVIPCGLSDNTNDAPQSKKDIKKIFTNYLNHETDVQHTFVKNFNVYTLENTLTETETVIAGQKVPAYSWIASVMVINPEIQQMIREKKLNGFSLGAVSDQSLNENADFLNKSLRYEDLNDSEDLNPLFISLVEYPANGFKFEVYDYESFLEKSYKSDNMSENEKTKGYVSENLLERVLNVFMTKSETSDEEKEELKKEDAQADISNKELLEQLPGAVAKAVIEALNSFAKENNLEKSEDEKKKEEELLEKKDDKEEEELLEKNLDEKDEEETKLEKSYKRTGPSQTLTKSTTKIVDNGLYRKKDTFLNSDTRDMFGRNKKYL